LDPVRRRLTRDGEPMKLPAKQLETLLYLVENAGRVIEKDELFAAVWPGRMVEESSLTQTIFLLRRALQADEADRYIITAPGRGYRFAANVVHGAAGADAMASMGGVPPGPQMNARPAGAMPAVQPPARVLSWRFGWRARVACIGAGAVLVLLGVFALVLRRAPAPAEQAVFKPPAHSVAVLAFTNMSGDPARDFFADGLSEELINTLSRIDELQVAARMSAFTFKDGKATVGEIGRKLNVGAVLEGSVRSSGARLRVTAQLVNAVTGYQFWSHTYDRDRGDVLQLETDIAEAVAQSLKITLVEDEKRKLTAGGTSNALAFDAYLRGSSLIRAFDEASARAGLVAFEEAIRLDPEFADAHAGRALALWTLSFRWPDNPAPFYTGLRQALAEADKAVAEAPRSARAHAVRAEILEWHLDLREAETEAMEAHALDSGDILVERIYGRIESHRGHLPEAEAAARHLVTLDPLSAAQYYQEAGILGSIGKFEDSLDALRREQAIGTVNVPGTRQMMAEAHFGLGNYRAVLADCANVCDDVSLALVAAADMKLGLVTEAKAALAKLQSNPVQDMAPLYAGVYAQWGETEIALHWLEVAFARRSSGLCWMRSASILDPIRNTPRFIAIEQKLGFPPRTR
jgi:TolB-like protein/DNA-binding winged helix-turn-helix (wHTH) protein/Tfp pilus assembly protein PilF